MSFDQATYPIVCMSAGLLWLSLTPAWANCTSVMANSEWPAVAHAISNARLCEQLPVGPNRTRSFNVISAEVCRNAGDLTSIRAQALLTLRNRRQRVVPVGTDRGEGDSERHARHRGLQDNGRPHGYRRRRWRPPIRARGYPGPSKRLGAIAALKIVSLAVKDRSGEGISEEFICAVHMLPIVSLTSVIPGSISFAVRTGDGYE